MEPCFHRLQDPTGLDQAATAPKNSGSLLFCSAGLALLEPVSCEQDQDLGDPDRVEQEDAAEGNRSILGISCVDLELLLRDDPAGRAHVAKRQHVSRSDAKPHIG